MRWAISVKAIAYGLADGDRLLAEQQRAIRRIAAAGRRSRRRRRGRRPSRSSEAWERINGEGYGSFHLTRAAMHGLLLADQESCSRRTWIASSSRCAASSRDATTRSRGPICCRCIPAYRADPSVLERSRRLLSELDGSLPTLTRQLTEHADELDRQIKVRAFAEQG